MSMKNNQVLQGEALSILKGLKSGQFDGIITDPPYSSGGANNRDKLKATSQKYTGTKEHCPYPDFEGDTKDQRSWTNWAAQWLGECRRVAKPGTPICVFTDWRQLPSLTDALQWAGWIWRGVVPWDKKNTRPQKGRFRQDAEFVVWGSNGSMDINRPVPILPGCYSFAIPSPKTRQHQTEKPLPLMRALVQICEPGGNILDPFCGSGSTLEAAILEGYTATGIELVPHYAEIAKRRIATGERAMFERDTVCGK